MISYRKNEDWNILTFNLYSLEDLSLIIKNKLDSELANTDIIDIVDISINPVKDNYRGIVYSVLVSYAYIKKKEKK